MYSRVLVQPPVEPLTLTEVKLDRAIDHTLHDALLTSRIIAAREYIEKHCQISIVTQTRESGFDCFTSFLELPYGPVQEVLAVEYTAIDGTVTPITDYVTDLYGPVPRVGPAYNALWPTPQTIPNAVKVRYVAGFDAVAGSPTDYLSNVPHSLRTAMYLLVGNWYENREATITGTINQALELGVAEMLQPYRMRKGMA